MASIDNLTTAVNEAIALLGILKAKVTELEAQVTALQSQVAAGDNSAAETALTDQLTAAVAQNQL